MQQKENTVPIIEPVARELLLAELTPARKMRNTHRAGNEIYIFSAAECPSLMREVGRLREAAFRGAGGGTGQEVDIDEEDLAGDGYYQLIVWDPSAQEIVGGYRFIVCTTPNPRHLSTEHYFRFSERFRRKFLPRTIELGRSFVQPAYQVFPTAKLHVCFSGVVIQISIHIAVFTDRGNPIFKNRNNCNSSRISRKPVVRESG